MIHLARRLAGPAPRALLLASLALLAAGAAVLTAADARPQTVPETAAAPAPFVSDRLSVEVIGEGPDVILIPGFASSREVWRAEAERLSGTHRVHLVQFAGFAGEPWRHGDGPFLQPALDELARYVRDGRLDRPAVIGHSMGGSAALALAQAHPERVGRVMTVDSLPFLPALYGPQATVETARPFAEQAAASMLTLDDAAFRDGQARMAPGMARDPAAQAAMVEASVASDRRALASAIRDVMLLDTRDGLGGMTLTVWAVYASDADGGAPAAMADAMWSREYAALPGVTLIRVDGSRHFIMADQPARLAEIIDRFLAE